MDLEKLWCNKGNPGPKALKSRECRPGPKALAQREREPEPKALKQRESIKPYHNGFGIIIDVAMQMDMALDGRI